MKMCVTAFVFGDYKRFIPYFCYSVAKSYPEYHVKIFVDGRLSDAERACIEDIRANVSKNVLIEEMAFHDIELPAAPTVRGGEKMFLRWLFERRDFEGFDYIYFSDIDFLVLRQEPGLAEFHIENARCLGLPFSNMVRTNKKDPALCSNRLSGLHFVLADTYFDLVEPLVREYKRSPASIMESVPGAASNEEFLFHLVKKCVPFDEFKLRNAPRPIPGVHLPWSHNLPKMGKRTTRMREAANPRYPELDEQLASFCADPVFLRMLWKVKVPEIAVFLSYMNILPSNFLDYQKISFLRFLGRASLWSRLIKERAGV